MLILPLHRTSYGRYICIYIYAVFSHKPTTQISHHYFCMYYICVGRYWKFFGHCWMIFAFFSFFSLFFHPTFDFISIESQLIYYMWWNASGCIQSQEIYCCFFFLNEKRMRKNKLKTFTNLQYIAELLFLNIFGCTEGIEGRNPSSMKITIVEWANKTHKCDKIRGETPLPVVHTHNIQNLLLLRCIFNGKLCEKIAPILEKPRRKRKKKETTKKISRRIKVFGLS